MQEMTCREAQAQFYRLIKGNEVVHCISKGKCIGKIIPELCFEEGEEGKVAEVKENRATLEDLKRKYDFRNEAKEEEVKKKIPCFSCGRASVGSVKQYDFDLGEERAEAVCNICAKGRGAKVKYNETN